MTDLSFLDRVDPQDLTTKQRRVYRALVKGKEPAKIATQMGITPSGVYAHIRSIQEKAAPAARRKTAPPKRANGHPATNGSAGYAEAVAAIAASLKAEHDGADMAQKRIAELEAEEAEVRARLNTATSDRESCLVRAKALDEARTTLSAVA